jgi:hypothetical protein
LRNVHLQNSDFSNADFTRVDISGDDFNTCQLTNAKLLPAKFDGSTFETSNWWDAAIINKALLQMLIDGAYPTKDQHFFPPPPRPTRLKYVSSVLALCHKADLTCTEANIPYEQGRDWAAELIPSIPITALTGRVQPQEHRSSSCMAAGNSYTGRKEPSAGFGGPLDLGRLAARA